MRWTWAEGDVEGGRPSGPAGRIPVGERHALAIRQSLRWAQRCAREGDYERALGWLAMVERIEGTLPEPWPQLRKAWQAAWRAQSRQRPARGPGPKPRPRPRRR